MEHWDSLFSPVGVESVNDLLKANKRDGLVPVKKQVTRSGKTFTTTVWVSPVDKEKMERGKKQEEETKERSKKEEQTKLLASKVQDVLRPIRKSLGTSRYKDYLNACGITWDRNPDNEGADTLRASMAAKKFLESGGRLDKELYEKMLGGYNPKPEEKNPPEKKPEEKKEEPKKEEEKPKSSGGGLTLRRGEKITLGGGDSGKKEKEEKPEEKPSPKKVSELSREILDIARQYKDVRAFRLVLSRLPKEKQKEFEDFVAQFEGESSLSRFVNAVDAIKKEIRREERAIKKAKENLKPISAALGDVILMSEDANEMLSNVKANGNDTLGEFQNNLVEFMFSSGVTDADFAMNLLFKEYKKQLVSKRSVLGKFSSHEEGYASIKKNFPNIHGVNFDDTPLELVEKVADTLERFENIYPGFTSEIGAVGSSVGLTQVAAERTKQGEASAEVERILKRAYKRKGVRAAVIEFLNTKKTDNNSMYFDSGHLGSDYFEESKKKFSKSSEDNWTVIGDPSDPIKNIVVHETSHVVHSKMIREFGDSFDKPLKSMYRKLGKKKISEEISEYGSSQYSEFIAEALCDFYTSSSPSEVSKQVGEYFETHGKQLNR